MGLRRYKAKRDFRQTSEPSGKEGSGANRASGFFVVQKHDASRLHYDFRLEMEGVLKSWAVPKGFPTRKGEKHLAVQVEDHPAEYGDFEGTIPPGNYGAGTVMVWDRGPYEVLGNHPSEALKHGRLHLLLSGRKLKGEWALVRMRRSADKGEKENWLLLKTGGDVRPISARAENQSVLSGRTLQQIAHANEAQWQSHRSSARAISKSAPKRRKKENEGQAGAAFTGRRSRGTSARASKIRRAHGSVARGAASRRR